MKRLFLSILLPLLLLPCAAAAAVPFEGFFNRAADRLGVPADAQRRVVAFAASLRDDVMTDCVLTPAWPPVFDITFASGRVLRADSRGIRVSDYDYDDDDDWLLENYASLCIIIFIAGMLLFWTGFFALSFQLAVTGAELVFFVLALCL